MHHPKRPGEETDDPLTPVKKKSRNGAPAPPAEGETPNTPYIPAEIWFMILCQLPWYMLPFVRMVCKDWYALLPTTTLPFPPDADVASGKRAITYALVETLVAEGHADLLGCLPLVGLYIPTRNKLLHVAIRNGDHPTFERVMAFPRVWNDNYLSEQWTHWQPIYWCLESNEDATRFMQTLILRGNITVPTAKPGLPPRSIPLLSNLLYVIENALDAKAKLRQRSSYFRQLLLHILRVSPCIELFTLVQSFRELNAAELRGLLLSCVGKDLVDMVRYLLPIAERMNVWRPSEWDDFRHAVRSEAMSVLLYGTTCASPRVYTCHDVCDGLLKDTGLDLFRTTCSEHVHSTFIGPDASCFAGRVDLLVEKIEWAEENNRACPCHRIVFIDNTDQFLDRACEGPLSLLVRLWDLISKLWDVTYPRLSINYCFTSERLLLALGEGSSDVASWILEKGFDRLGTLSTAREILMGLASWEEEREAAMRWVFDSMVPLLPGLDMDDEPEDMFGVLSLQEVYYCAFSEGNVWLCFWLVTQLRGFREWYVETQCSWSHGQE